MLEDLSVRMRGLHFLFNFLHPAEWPQWQTATGAKELNRNCALVTRLPVLQVCLEMCYSHNSEAACTIHECVCERGTLGADPPILAGQKCQR